MAEMSGLYFFTGWLYLPCPFSYLQYYNILYRKSCPRANYWFPPGKNTCFFMRSSFVFQLPQVDFTTNGVVEYCRVTILWKLKGIHCNGRQGSPRRKDLYREHKQEGQKAQRQEDPVCLAQKKEADEGIKTLLTSSYQQPQRRDCLLFRSQADSSPPLPSPAPSRSLSPPLPIT